MTAQQTDDATGRLEHAVKKCCQNSLMNGWQQSASWQCELRDLRRAVANRSRRARSGRAHKLERASGLWAANFLCWQHGWPARPGGKKATGVAAMYFTARDPFAANDLALSPAILAQLAIVPIPRRRKTTCLDNEVGGRQTNSFGWGARRVLPF